MMRIALYQLTSTLDYKENLSKISQAAKKCQEEKVHHLFLPECFYSLSNGVTPSPYLVEASNEHFENIKSLAKKYSLNLLGGSAATKTEQGIMNRAYNFSGLGEDLGSYDKRKLFSCDLGKGKSISEADIYSAGANGKIIKVDGMSIGLGICFDVRFSALALEYRHQGANVLTYSSAFTVPTGKAHWHTLLKARAIESQCYVIACAQWGQNNERIKTYGHSLVVDPWGEVILDAGEGEGLHFCEIDLSFVDKVRSRIPMT